MAKKKDVYTEIPVQEMEIEGSPTSAEANQAEDELEERFDKDFWLKVKCLIIICCSCAAWKSLFMSLDYLANSKKKKTEK